MPQNLAMNTTSRIFIREPGNCTKYVVLVTDLTSLTPDDREAMGGNTFLASIVNLRGRPTMMFSSRVALSYLMEKCPALGESDAQAFADICNEVLETPVERPWDRARDDWGYVRPPKGAR